MNLLRRHCDGHGSHYADLTPTPMADDASDDVGWLRLGIGGAPAGEMRVVRPPWRPRAGIWFSLRAAQNQGRPPFLPQIPKSYLRIKDGRATVSLLMKYLMSKLGLDDESEVEITCRGQLLLPFLTLQHVRDIWFLTATMETDHYVMTLQYGRSGSPSLPCTNSSPH